MKPYEDIIASEPDSTGKVVFEYRGRYFEVSLPMASLLEHMQKCRTEEEGIASYCALRNGIYTTGQIRQVLEASLKPVIQNRQEQTSAFIWKKQVINADMVNLLSKPLSCLFNLRLFSTVIIVTAICNFCFFCLLPDVLLFNNYISGIELIGLLLFVISSSLIHELGHAAACSSYKIKHGGIGIAFYLNFPVMFTDVTAIWTLNQSKRCIVNLAGIYFQCYILLVLMVEHLYFGDALTKYMIISLDMGILLTLNPFFKFDGYWLASDLLHVSNLRARSRSLLNNFVQRSLGKKVKKLNLSDIPPIRRILFVTYAIIVNLFFLFFFLYVIPKFLIMLISAFPKEAKLLSAYLSNGMNPPFALVRDIISQTVFATLLGYWAFLLAKRLSKLKQAKTKPNNSPCRHG